MNNWIIPGIIIVLAVVLSSTFLISGAIAQAEEGPSETKTYGAGSSCGSGSCSGSCTAEDNCGVAGCGAVSGGGCGCGK